ncbi:MAG: GAF domain-containing protein [Desulfovibrionaceae bacterium]|nr:GAF domain-containing protein [Desulfovibrionaceae bacterium]
MNTVDKSTLTIICSVFDAYSAVLFLPEAEEDCRLASFFSLGDRILSPEEADPGKGLVRWIARNRQPLLVPNFDQSKSRLGYYQPGEEAYIKAFMGCPVPGGGVLCVDSKRQYSFSDKDHKILQLFAELVGQHQRNGMDSPVGDIPRYFAQLGIIQELRFRYKRWPVFLEHFLHTVREATGFDYCAFASCDEGSQSYTIEGETAPLMLDGQNPAALPLSSGIVGWVFRDGQAIFSEATGDASSTAPFGKVGDVSNFQTVMCLPVVISQSTRGVLCLAHTTALPMPEVMRSFVRQATDHLALFLENLYLKNRLRSLLPKAKLHSKGAVAFNPDNAPDPFEEN